MVKDYCQQIIPWQYICILKTFKSICASCTFVYQVDLDVIIWLHTWTSELNDADWILRLIIADQINGKGCVITIKRLNWIWLKVKMTTILVDICTRCCLVLNISNNSCTMVYTFITETSACTLPETIYAVITAAHCHNVISLIILISMIKSILRRRKEFYLLMF